MAFPEVGPYLVFLGQAAIDPLSGSNVLTNAAEQHGPLKLGSVWNHWTQGLLKCERRGLVL